MASITIRGIEDDLKMRLRVAAARSGHSMEEEARQLLRSALMDAGRPPENLAEAIHARFRPLGGVTLPKVPHQPIRKPPTFD